MKKVFTFILCFISNFIILASIIFLFNLTISQLIISSYVILILSFVITCTVYYFIPKTDEWLHIFIGILCLFVIIGSLAFVSTWCIHLLFPMYLFRFIPFLVICIMLIIFAIILYKDRSDFPPKPVVTIFE